MSLSRKENLKLWKQTEGFEKRIDLKNGNGQMVAALAVCLQMQKESLEQQLVPQKAVLESPMYQNVIASFYDWFEKIEGKEYFVLSLGTLYEAVCQNSTNDFFNQTEGIASILNKIVWKMSELNLKQKQYTEEEQIFMGSFRNCFPDVDALNSAKQFFHHFMLYRKTFEVLDTEELTLGEIVETALFWNQKSYYKSIQILERKK